MPETAIRPVLLETVLPSAPCVECKAQPDDAGTPARSHSAAVRRAGKAGNDTRPIYGLWHYAKPYRYKRFKDDDAAWMWARTHGYRYDGRIEE